MGIVNSRLKKPARRGGRGKWERILTRRRTSIHNPLPKQRTSPTPDDTVGRGNLQLIREQQQYFDRLRKSKRISSHIGNAADLIENRRLGDGSVATNAHRRKSVRYSQMSLGSEQSLVSNRTVVESSCGGGYLGNSSLNGSRAPTPSMGQHPHYYRGVRTPPPREAYFNSPTRPLSTIEISRSLTSLSFRSPPTSAATTTVTRGRTCSHRNHTTSDPREYIPPRRAATVYHHQDKAAIQAYRERIRSYRVYCLDTPSPPPSASGYTSPCLSPMPSKAHMTRPPSYYANYTTPSSPDTPQSASSSSQFATSVSVADIQAEQFRKLQDPYHFHHHHHHHHTSNLIRGFV
ncbi:hypothetical protein IWQ61_004676 [Dispira simplex]|nr:hypothetical protein IWQ61_004676 [Dispira simplex]